MIYNIHRGIYWKGGGIEYARAYRAEVLRDIGQDAKFIYTDMFPLDNIQHIAESYGFLSTEIIWLYTFFTTCRIAPSTYTLGELERTFASESYTFSREGTIVKYLFPESNGLYLVAYMVDDKNDYVHRVEMISGGCLLRRDYYTYCRIYSEYFAPLNRQAHLYQRRFFNEDGTIAYEEIIDNDKMMYRFKDKLLYSKGELIGYMMSCLNLTEKDVVIIDSMEEIGQAVMRNTASAQVGFVFHLDHSRMEVDRVPWLDWYIYALSQYKNINFFITATDAQNFAFKEQFEKFMRIKTKVVTIPPGSLKELKIPKKDRKKHSLITASRLVKEKKVNWIVEAVILAKTSIADLSLDIYGRGPEEKKIKEQIEKLHCSEYVHLCGHQELSDVYKNYEAYVSASMSESFGLTFMEAVGSGLPIVAFDVHYGNQDFIDHEENGYKIAVNDRMEKTECIKRLAECIVRLFTEADLEKFQGHSYEKAKNYLTEKVEKRWADLLDTVDKV